MRSYLVLGFMVLVGIALVKKASGWLTSNRRGTHNTIPEAAARTSDPRLILRDVNRYRRQHGLAPLRYSKTCQAAARIQVEYNAAHGTYTHANPDFARAGDRLKEVGYKYAGSRTRWAENICRYTLSRDAGRSSRWHVFNRYHISPPHDQEMLDPKVTNFGTASVVDEDGVLYNAEVFAN